jgi:hypothetical protein
MRFQKCQAGAFVGEVRADFAEALNATQLEGLLEKINSDQNRVLSKGRHQVVVIDFEIAGHVKQCAVKAFGSQNKWKDRYDFNHGSKASRSFKAANYLHQRQVLTPAPIAYVERWEGMRLAESYFLSSFVKGMTSFRDQQNCVFAGEFNAFSKKSAWPSGRCTTPVFIIVILETKTWNWLPSTMTIGEKFISSI